MRCEATPARAPRSRLRRHGSGWAVAARGFFVWEESRRDAESWERELAGHASGLRAAIPGRSFPVDANDGAPPRRARESRPRAP